MRKRQGERERETETAIGRDRDRERQRETEREGERESEREGRIRPLLGDEDGVLILFQRAKAITQFSYYIIRLLRWK